MDFLKSVLSDEPTPPESPPKSPSNPDPNNKPSSPSTTAASATSPWSLGGLIKTLATKSESVLEAYRRDIEELGSGLRKETSLIREVASRAVKDLPASLEAGASVAQDSLESVGQAIDDIGSSVAHLILRGNPLNDPSPDYRSSTPNSIAKGPGFEAKYSRLDAQVRGLQGDLDTYCREPEDIGDYEEWRLSCWVFDEERKEEIGRLLRENEVVREVFDEVVPSRINTETFWRRYFYRLDRLKRAEEARASIVKRAILGDGEEDLSWDSDEDDDDKTAGGSGGNVVLEEKDVGKVEDLGEIAGGSDGKEVEEEKAMVEVGKGSGSGNGNGESCKDSDVSVVSSQSMLAEVEDLGWDEIEYSGSNDEGKGDVVGSTTVASGSSRVDLQKRMSAAEAEEDLSWDIEDEDDEPAKS